MTNGDCEEVNLLKQQIVNLFEDFKSERQEKLRLIEQNKSLQLDLDTMFSELIYIRQKHKEISNQLELSNRENAALKIQLQQSNDSIANERNGSCLNGSKNRSKDQMETSNQCSKAVHHSSRTTCFVTLKGTAFVRWSCGTCTYENFPLRNACEMCGSAKQSKKFSIEDFGDLETDNTVLIEIEEHLNILECRSDTSISAV